MTSGEAKGWGIGPDSTPLGKAKLLAGFPKWPSIC